MGRDLWFPSALWEGKQDVFHVHRLREPGFLRRKSNCPRRTPLISSSRFKGSPALIALPSCFPNTLLLWGGLGHRCLPSCQTAGTDEAPRRVAQKKRDGSPHPSHHHHPPLTPSPPGRAEGKQRCSKALEIRGATGGLRTHPRRWDRRS